MNETTTHRGSGRRWITHWEPENEGFWASTGRRIATRNLIWSILAENLGFSIWLLWSVVVVSLPAVGFAFSTDQLFWLVSIPNLVGATLRLPYTFAVPRFGGRNWTLVSVALLLLPTTMLAVAVSHPGTPYWFFVLAAATAGVGGGNFASSMANISFFYPERRKGLALGLNAAGGNLGVAIVQACVPFVIAIGSGLTIAYAGLMWMPLLVVASFGAWFGMDNLATAKSNFADQVVVAKYAQTWVVSALYVATFGSFIGYSAAMPLLIKTQYHGVTVSHYAFLGALVGSISRPFGGWLADRFGGAKVTLVNFFVMAAGTAAVWWTVDHGASFGAFLGCFMVLFVSSGIGNGSTFRVIPAVFRHRALAAAGPSDAERNAALATGRREAAAVIGIASAIGAYGGFLIPRGFAVSLKHSGSLAPALVAFLCCYLVSALITWWCYLRTRVLVERVPSLAAAAA